MCETPYNKLPGADLHGGAGMKGPAEREIRYREGKPASASDKEE